jgi:hypothetical protein
MSGERTSYSSRTDERDGYYHADREPGEVTVGTYRPRERVLGLVAASAAATEFLRATADVVAATPPDAPPHRRDDTEQLDEEQFAEAA